MERSLFGIDLLTAYGGRTACVRKGAILFLQGEVCVEIGYVSEGRIEIRSSTPDGREWQIQSVDPDAFFGDVLTFSGEQRYLGNVVVATDAIVSMIGRADFLRLLSGHPELLEAYLSALGRKTFDIKQQVKMLSLPSLRSRILFWLGWRLGDARTGSVAIPGTKERLAEMLAVERPSLSRELAHMKKDRLLDYSRTEITLL
ncbi:MAG: Crp/Fnr family transcriptional regulator [Bacillota bacterium]|nr:Crp/Fnr family transcriptional regulator [Bacillota bacterium]